MEHFYLIQYKQFYFKTGSIPTGEYYWHYLFVVLSYWQKITLLWKSPSTSLCCRWILYGCHFNWYFVILLKNDLLRFGKVFLLAVISRLRFRARRTAPMSRRLPAVLGLLDLCLQRFWLIPSSRYFLKLFLIVTGVGGALPNLLNSCWTWTALCVSANLRTIKALWRGVNFTPTMMSSKLINEDPCSNHGLLDGVGNIINNVYSLKHVKHDKYNFIRYNYSQQIDVNNTHLLGCCLSWSRIVCIELGKSVA